MIIIRNGIEIELTSEELLQAYQEQEHIFSRDNILENMDQYVDDNLCEELKEDKRFLDSAVYWLEKYSKEYGYDYEDSIEQAFKESLQEREMKIERNREKKYGRSI